MSTESAPISIDNATARTLLLHLQGLTRPPQRRLKGGDLLELITQLGFVQVDSIQWVERAHHMILHARSQSYRPKHLTRLAEKERVLFENWTHDASFIPVAFFPYWRRRFERSADRLRDRITNWQGEGYIAELNEMLERVAREGAVRSRDLDKPDGAGKQGMWQWHDGKTALEYLWRTGKLCIAARDNFQKVYDLTERVLAPEYCTCALPSHDEYVDWACSSALHRLGFGTAKDISAFWELVSLDETKQWLARQAADRVRQVAVQPADRKAPPRLLYARRDIEDVIADLPNPPPRIRALSPFDPLIRDRNRLTWLFDFDYRIEIYVPEAKRKYGYYIFPLLEGRKLIGRIDMRAARGDGELQVRKLWLERGVKWSAARAKKLQDELERQAKLCGLEQVAWVDGPESNI